MKEEGCSCRSLSAEEKIVKIADCPTLREEAAKWFAEAWGIPCAVYTEPEYRCRGYAGKLLKHMCAEMSAQGIDTLYLLTNHTTFYERYGWEFYCMAQGDGEEEMSRMYVHHS